MHLRFLSTAPLLLYSLSLSYPTSVSMLLRSTAENFRSSTTAATAARKISTTFIIFNQIMFNHSKKYNALAKIFSCVSESWRISTSQISFLGGIGLFVTAPTLVKFLESNGPAFQKMQADVRFLCLVCAQTRACTGFDRFFFLLCPISLLFLAFHSLPPCAVQAFHSCMASSMTIAT